MTNPFLPENQPVAPTVGLPTVGLQPGVNTAVAPVNPSPWGGGTGVGPAQPVPEMSPDSGYVPSNQPKNPVGEVTFDDDVKVVQLEKLQLAKGEKARISFVLFKVNASGQSSAPVVRQSSTLFDKVSQTLFIAPEHDTNLLNKVVNKIGKDPTPRFGAVVIRYTTDPAGNMIRMPKMEDMFKYYAFLFSTDKWVPLKALHKEFRLETIDLMIECTEAEFQKCTITPCKEKWIAGSPLYAQIQERAKVLYERHLLTKMGKNLSDEELLSLLGLLDSGSMVPAGVNPFTTQVAPSAPPLAQTVGTGAPVQREDFSGIVQSPGASAPPVQTAPPPVMDVTSTPVESSAPKNPFK